MKEYNCNCYVCKKPMYRKPSYIKRHKYGCTCSHECMVEMKKQLNQIRYEDNNINYYCAECGKHLIGKKTHHKKFCSLSCASNNRYNGSLVYGIGYNDIRSTKKEYLYEIRGMWKNMIKRCYDEDYHNNHKSYIGCTVCEEWLTLSNFYDWVIKRYKKGWHLDKDILIKGNKIYSPDTCCFVPSEINSAFVGQNAIYRGFPVGIKVEGEKYISTYSRYNKSVRIGSFDNLQEAIYARCKHRYIYIKELTDKYKDQLEPKVYKALIAYYKFQELSFPF